MAVGADSRPVSVAGVPDGLNAHPLHEYRRDDSGRHVPVRTRRRLLKLERVELLPAGAPQATSVSPAEERWLLGADRRRWSSISRRYGTDAWRRAVELTCAGVVRLRCRVDDELRLGEPIGWVLSEDWQRKRAGAEQVHAAQRERWQERADTASVAVESRSPELAAALRAASPGTRTARVLVCAAEDLVEGVVNAGPRGFSQAHFGDSKAHDDVAAVLRGVGIDDETLLRLGVRRSARLGVAGPVIAEIAGRALDLALLDGPVLIRSDQQQLQLRLAAPVPLVIVENLQAAETLADQVPEVAVAYTAGLLGQAALGHLAKLASMTKTVLLVPDADLGGVRIAEQVLTAAPAAQLIDIGDRPHMPGRRWPEEGASVKGLRSACAGPAGALAWACLERGYPVEQELATVEAVSAKLDVKL